MKTLVIIPARSGSKGLKDKNIKLLNSKPLIHYSIEAAQEVFSNEDICFTTDSSEYIKIAKETGIEVPFVRPKELALDNSTSRDVILHCIEFYENKGISYDTVLLLQPTSPFRNKEHLTQILESFNPEYNMVVSVKETNSNPYYVLAEENEEGYLEKSKKGNFTRRQDCPKVYEYNGSMYLINVNSLKQQSISEFTKVKKFEMEKEFSIDIDNQLDFDFAEFKLSKNS
ncbi:MAG: acylneuraminate cytidylyltransferase family protein [Flavobacteriales bacterium]|jgi:CMP-N,N'-diacetyllegionaminic acid synthase|nr:acylneuraminate cytidylyltransferase family protein [Flavobacteriales bacterium]|tara:strand:+ start:12 stop:695 length:684 start_codon:yes stop_codon:yes gene_type:complete